MGELIERKKRILMNEPHLVHAPVGNNFDVIIAEPKISGMKIYFNPLQNGSGTPSPTNKRSIGRYTLSVKIGEKTFTKEFGTINIKGYFDCDTGDRHVTWGSMTFNGSTGVTSYVNRGTYSTFWLAAGELAIYNSPDVTLLSNIFTWTGSHYKYDSVPDWSFAGASAYPNSFWMRVPNSALPALSLDGAKAWLSQNNVQVVAPRKNGEAIYNSGAMEIMADRGRQLVSAMDIDSLEFDYWTH